MSQPANPDTSTADEPKTEAAMNQDDTAEAVFVRRVGGMPPADWQDPAAQERRRQWLCTVARAAAAAVVEMLTHTCVRHAQGGASLPQDAPVGDLLKGLHELHVALIGYRHTTRLHDGEQFLYGAAVAEAGAGIAAVVTGLLERLRADFTRAMRMRSGDLFRQ